MWNCQRITDNGPSSKENRTPTHHQLKQNLRPTQAIGIWASSDGHGKSTSEKPEIEKLKACLPSGNQTWQWKMDHLSMIFQLKPPFIYRGFSIAIFDYQRVTPIKIIICLHYIQGQSQLHTGNDQRRFRHQMILKFIAAQSCLINLYLKKFYHTPYAPCIVYLPTFGWCLRPMLVYIPYMEHMGTKYCIMWDSPNLINLPSDCGWLKCAIIGMDNLGNAIRSIMAFGHWV